MWTTPQPTEAQDDTEKINFLREVWTRVRFAAFLWTPPPILANSGTAFTVAPVGVVGASVNTNLVIGTRTGMGIAVNPPAALPFGLIANCVVTASDRLEIDILNVTGGPLTPPAGKWTFWGVIV